MRTVDDLHNEAMDHAETAFFLRKQGTESESVEMFYRALDLEMEAASRLADDRESEPSRSILYHSAASLAYNSGEYETADWLIAKGLAGFPPTDVREDLKNLYEDVNFRRHLAAKGILVSNRQWLMSLSGNATAYGAAIADQLLPRMDKATTLIYRTIERLLKRAYRMTGSVEKSIKDQFAVLINAFAPSSFAVSFQVGQPDQQLPLMPDYVPIPTLEPGAVIVEIMECFTILESSRPEDLKERIPDTDYYENFVGLHKQLAPDGDEIRVVSFAYLDHGHDLEVHLRKTRAQLRRTGLGKDATEEEPRLELLGELRHANSPERGRFGTVKLHEAGTGAQHVIRVPIALMKDIVQPFYEESVVIDAYDKKGKLYFVDIRAAR